MISGAFYDFNLDFGCCFGTALPTPVSFQRKNPDFLLKNVDFLLKNVDFIIKPIIAPPDTSSSGEIYLQRPSYRTVLVNGSTAGVRFYPLNAEQDFGEAHTEIRYSRNVTMYGAKSENNYVVLWIRDSDLVVSTGEQSPPQDHMFSGGVSDRLLDCRRCTAMVVMRRRSRTRRTSMGREPTAESRSTCRRCSACSGARGCASQT